MKITTPNGEELEIRKATLHDNDILLNQAYASREENLARFIENVSGEKFERINEFIFSDIIYIMRQEDRYYF